MNEKTEKKRPLQARSRATVDAIREATARILGREGLAKLSTNRIAEVAGVSVGSLYQFFRNKDSILSDLVNESIERNFTNVLAAIDRGTAAEARGEIRPFVTALVGTVFANFDRENDVQRALIQQAPHLIGMGPVRKFDERVRPILLRYFRESGMRLRPTDVDLALYTLASAVRGALVGALMDGLPPERMERVKAETIELCVRYLEPEKN
jgi:AcrR family transcriptional regulator